MAQTKALITILGLSIGLVSTTVYPMMAFAVPHLKQSYPNPMPRSGNPGNPDDLKSYLGSHTVRIRRFPASNQGNPDIPPPAGSRGCDGSSLALITTPSISQIKVNQARPTLWFNIPYNSDQIMSADLTLTSLSLDDNVVKHAEVDLPPTGGIVPITWPANWPALDARIEYEVVLSVQFVCNEATAPEQEKTVGQVIYQPLASEVISSIQALPIEQQPQEYINQGYFPEALNIFVHQCTAISLDQYQPFWDRVLTQVGLIETTINCEM